MSDPIPAAVVVQSIADEYAYIAQQRCPTCGGAYHVVQQTLLHNNGRPYDGMQARCIGCGHAQVFLFDISPFFGQS